MADATTEYLFVYGTLKRGFCREIALSGQHFIAEVATQPEFHLVDCGSYPGLIRQQPGRSIRGELFAIQPRLWNKLDKIEGTDIGLYRRIPVQLLAPYDNLVVQTYEYLGNTASLRDCGDCGDCWTKQRSG